MNTTNKQQRFNVLVVGDNPEALMEKYSSKNKNEKYIAYYYDQASEYRKTKLKILKGVLDMMDMGDNAKEIIRADYDYYNSLSDMDYYLELTDGYELDPTTGDAYTDKNKDSKFNSYNKNGIFSYPFITKNGQETYSAEKGNIDWERVHLADTRTYNVVWETVMEGREPEDEDERILYNNMKNRRAYLENFANKQDYVFSMASFWCYAYLDENGWKEIEGPQFEWVKNFYDKFIAPLSENAKLTIYDCTRD